MKLVAMAAAVAVVATPAQFLQSRQLADGGFAEPGASSSPELTAWASLALAAAGADARGALAYLRAHEDDDLPPTTFALVAMAEAALGDVHLVDRLPSSASRTNVAIWRILAFRQAGRPVPSPLVRTLLTRQLRSGGWGWAAGVAPDSNDTAAVVQALRAASVSGRPIRRALTYLRSVRNPDGGFALVAGHGSDAQSTAWAIQAFLAAGAQPPTGAFAYLRHLLQANGSYRYSARYAITPVWVTAQVLPALKKRPFPLPVR